MTKHFMEHEKPVESKMPSVLDLLEKYEEMRNKTRGVNEGMGLDNPVPSGPAVGPDMGDPAGALAPAASITPPIPPAGGAPGDAGDASLTPPPEIPETEPKEKEEDKEDKDKKRNLKKVLKRIREGLMDIEIALRELGALDDEEEEE